MLNTKQQKQWIKQRFLKQKQIKHKTLQKALQQMLQKELTY